jgi:7-cyano-7-deazaguanine synthase
MTTKAMVVLSGGQDSTTCLFWAKQMYDEVHAVTFDYGQKHARELEAATIIAEMAGVASHEVVEVGPILAGRSPLTNAAEELETYSGIEEMDAIIQDRVELTFVPARNLMFLTLAANRAVCRDIRVLVTGVCQADNANYPDCRDVFVRMAGAAISTAMGFDKEGHGPNFQIVTPLMDLSKPDSIRLAANLPGCFEALAYSHTAYSGEYPPLTQDHATVLRAWGFEQAGIPDPLIVRAWSEGLMELPQTGNYEALRASGPPAPPAKRTKKKGA